MNILILGSGGREHALAWKITQSPLCDACWIAPGNAGTAQVGHNLDIDPNQFEAVADAIRTHDIDMLVVGPEAPLVGGIRDYFEEREGWGDLLIVGPGKAGAQLEGSKDFAKAFMSRHGIPTARYGTFTRDQLEEAKTFLQTFEPPYVLKADGLAAGKGVVILDSLEEARIELDAMLADAKFGDASAKVVIEAFLDGVELSVFALTDGSHYVMLPEAKDYKRIGEGDTGLNTGGMGAVSPVSFADADFMKKVEAKVVKPTVDGLAKDGIPYVGFLFFGLINVGGSPMVIEYNARMGDPETEVVVPRISSDLVPALEAAARGKLSGLKLETDPRFATAVMLVSAGYPGSYSKGKTIEVGEGIPEALVFHAGTAAIDGLTTTAGGRVMAATAYGQSMKEALQRSYAQADAIHFDGKYMRRDIGRDL